MKKILVLFFIISVSPAYSEIITDFTNMCGIAGYHRLYAVPQNFTCESGYFLPANAIACVACPDDYTCNGGTYDFNETMAQGISPITPNLYTFTNEHNTCSENMVAKRMYAVPRSFTCASGYFLPANSYNCAICPNGYTCNGGTYVFNSTKAQGLTRNANTYVSSNTNNTCSANLGLVLNAIFIPKVYDCNPGYYLPANTDGCEICLVNNYCAGGTYSFNEEEDQGISECPSGKFSPAGAAICYEHKLHVGNESLYLRASKRTTPSLNVGYGNEVFYANMTTTPTYMTSGSTHYFKTIYNEQVYYICDDTMYGN